MKFIRDTKGQLALEWSQHMGSEEPYHKRAYIQRRPPNGKGNWANPPHGRYVIIVSLGETGNPLQGPDFPVLDGDISDEQVLLRVAQSLNDILGVTSKPLASG